MRRSTPDDAKLPGMNPVLQREIRARWRTWPAICILAAFTLLIAGEAALVVWLRALAQNPPPGRILLSYTAPFLLALWMLVAPAITATSIATERQKGLLLAVVLSGLTPLQIIRGKWLSAMAFSGLLLLVPMPVVAMSLVLGGVSPVELLLVALLQLSTLSGGCAVGLYFSATFERPFEALAASFALSLFVGAIPLISPILAAVFLLSSSSSTFDTSTTVWPALWCMVVLLLVTPQMLRATAAAIDRSFQPGRLAPPQVEGDAAQSKQTQIIELPAEIFQAEPEDWAEPEMEPEPTPPEYADPADGRWDYPLAKHIRSSDPLLQRDLELKFRLRMKPKLKTEGTPEESLPGADATSVVIFYNLLIATIVFGPTGIRTGLWMMFSTALMLGMPLAALLMGALTWTREKEQKTLIPLQMLPYLPAEFLWCKLAAIILACFFYAVPVLVPMLVCVRPWDNSGDEISVPHAVIVLAIIILGTVTAALWGAYVSLRSASSSRAVTVSVVGAVLFVWMWNQLGGGERWPAFLASLTVITAACWALQLQLLRGEV